MKNICVNASGKYEIVISKGIFEKSCQLIKNVASCKKAFIVCDSNVASLYLETLKCSLEKEGFTIYSHIYPAGEESKNLVTVEKILSDMASAELSRKDIAIALGGGVCGDMCGFCAAIYMRGIRFVQISTSLLAMVDSSVGGKTAVDISGGKNLVGAFHQPSLVICDTELLKTLPQRFMSDGMAEVIKYGCICDTELFDMLESKDSASVYSEIESIVARSIETKKHFVEIDEFESGPRMALNFGHTFGHALEKLYGFKTITHGEAVGIGMIVAADACETNRDAKPGTTKRITEVLKKYNLPVCDKNFTKADMYREISHDKKAVGGSVNFVLISEIGKYYIEKMEINTKAAKYFGVDK